MSIALRARVRAAWAGWRVSAPQPGLESLARCGNVQLVQSEGRRFPGLLIQGDTLRALLDDVEEELPDGAAADELRRLVGAYERLMRGSGLELPYDGPDQPRDDEAGLPAELILIGYWDGPHTRPGWPAPEDFVAADWDDDDRDMVADHLARGHVARACMGLSPCRVCGEGNGALELSDGTFVWPEGLRHYVTDHQVRLPDRFVEHVRAHGDGLERAVRDEGWWGDVGGSARAQRSEESR
jgi:hypothetical protein